MYGRLRRYRNQSRLHSFWPIWIWILRSKIRFVIPFHHNPILDCNPNNLPLEADRSDWYLKLVLDCSFHLINGFIDRTLNCLITWTADQKSQGNLDRENRSAFGLYVPAGQQSDPSFDWRIQIQIGQTECTPSLIQNLKKNMRYLRCVHVECGTLCWNFAKKAVSYCSNVLHPQSNLLTCGHYDTYISLVI